MYRQACAEMACSNRNYSRSWPSPAVHRRPESTTTRATVPRSSAGTSFILPAFLFRETEVLRVTWELTAVVAAHVLVGRARRILLHVGHLLAFPAHIARCLAAHFITTIAGCLRLRITSFHLSIIGSPCAELCSVRGGVVGLFGFAFLELVLPGLGRVFGHVSCLRRRRCEPLVLRVRLSPWRAVQRSMTSGGLGFFCDGT